MLLARQLNAPLLTACIYLWPNSSTMKQMLLSAALLFTGNLLYAQSADSTQKQVVEASCGQCRFGMKGEGCNLAVRINGKAYFVDGTAIDDHGDAHAQDGFCNAIRKAEVKGRVEKDRFVATYFKLLPEAKNK